MKADRQIQFYSTLLDRERSERGSSPTVKEGGRCALAVRTGRPWGGRLLFRHPGLFPVWLNDNRRVLFREGVSFCLLDRLEGKSQKIYSLKGPDQIGHQALARDNRRLYFTSVSSEADIWMLTLK